MGNSRKEWLADKHVKELNEKIRHSTRRMKTSFAVISASVLVSNLVEPVRYVMAEENASQSRKGTVAHSDSPFLNTLIPSASQIAQESDLYASVMLAQAILESGWGNSQLASAPNHNLFGIKGNYQGESTNMGTLEDSGNQNYYEIQADFRKYPSYHESLEDYASLLRNGINSDPLFYDGVWKSNADSYQDATAYLTGRYATDTAYNTKLNSIIESNGLTEYDSPSYTPPIVNDQQVEEQSDTGLTTGMYIVKSGDTLSAIASMQRVSVNELMSWNGLHSTLLYPGDQLKVLKQAPTVETINPEVQESKPEQNKPASGFTYKVTSGDSLWKIGHLNGVSVAQLKEWNNLSSDVIRPGQSLQLMNSTTEDETVPEKEETQPVENDSIHSQPVMKTVTVKSGDTLYRIAAQAGASVSQIKEWNHLTSDLIIPGQTLSIQAIGNTDPVVFEERKEVEKHTTVQNPSTEVQENVISTTYTIKNGDTLYKIANQTGVSVSQLQEWNQLTSDIILIGQTISVGSTGNTKPVDPGEVKEVEEQTIVQSQPAADAHENTESTIYTVKNEDTLYRIATQAGVSVSQIKEWNQLSSDTILMGQKIKTSIKMIEEKVKTPSINETQESSQIHEIKVGDTLYSLSNQYDVSVIQLIEWNNVTSNLIFVGQQLRVK